MAKNYRPIPVPDGVKVEIKPDAAVVKGKLGSMQVPIMPRVEVKCDGNEIIVEARSGGSRALVGTIRALVRNAFTGVTSGFEKVLQVRGMGYRAQKTNEGVQIQCGFSHTVDFPIPENLTVEVNQAPNPDDTKQQMFEIKVKGIDRQVVGEIAAEIRAIKPVDVYKGKGIRYRGEHVRKKAGKRAVGAQA